jgi:uncharacterized protein YraI
VHSKTILLFVAVMILCAACGREIAEVTTTPGFFTATLPPTSTPQATQTPPLPVSGTAEESNISPIEGVTTTQLNVRAGPSTASDSLGLIGPFVKVQIIGRDASGSWYQILYTESETGKGWVRAEYAQVNAPAEIPLVETESVPGSAISGLVIQKVNVRNGPGTTYESLGVLNSNDVVFITGRDSSGKWIQIEFAGAPDGRGWLTAELLQADGLENAPLIGAAAEATPIPTVEIPISLSAILDGDSMQSPLATASLSPTGSRALQLNGEVSAPDGDVEDWIQFSVTNNRVIKIEAVCSSTALRVELWKNENPVRDFSCGKPALENIEAGSNYFLRLIQNEPGYTGYALNLEVIP